MLDETALIRADLAALNAAGFLTASSQPALTDVKVPGRGRVVQRAEVFGYAHAYVVEQIVAVNDDSLMCLTTAVSDLVYRTSFIVEPGECIWTQRTFARGAPRSGTSRIPSRDQFDAHFRATRPEARADAERAMAVTVIDLEWGRERHLWDTLIAALS